MYRLLELVRRTASLIRGAGDTRDSDTENPNGGLRKRRKKKRRLSETQPLANKRLTNGLIKSNHVTTRSQAKNDPSSRLSPTRKVKHKALTGEERRLEISMCLRHEEKQSTKSSLSPTQQQHLIRRRKLELAVAASSSRRTNGFNNVKFTKGGKSRSRLLQPISQAQSPPNRVTCMHEKGVVAQKRAREAENREARARKRRSALWVLNCEAEEFLFGETAAEDHEVELPPMSPPPKKRRRMRATELGALLKETPLLESKLRNPPPSSTESEESCSSLLSSPTSLSNGSTRKPKVNYSTSKRSLQYHSGRMKSEKEFDSGHTGSESEDGELSESYDLSTTLSMLVDSANPADFDPTIPQSVRMQNILNSLRWKFSFEEVPTCEVWFQTFCRQDSPRDPFQSPPKSPVILPYQGKNLCRSPKKSRRPPRKSPRCHASTQAILSSLKPGKGSKGAGSATTSPETETTPKSTNGPSVGRPKVIDRSKPLPAPVQTLNRHLFRNSPILPSASTSSSVPVPNIQATLKSCEITATQYLWDSIQFLSDPYVIQVLSACAPVGTRVSPKPKGQNKSTLTSTRSMEAETTSALGSSSGVTKGNQKGKGPRSILSSTRSLDSPLQLVIPSPKTSPRLQNGSNGSDLIRSKAPKVSPPTSPAHCRVRSPLTSPPCYRMKSPPSSPRSVRKSPRKSPVVLVSDILKNRLSKLPGSPGQLGPWELDEEVTFATSPSRLPEMEWSIFL